MSLLKIAVIVWDDPVTNSDGWVTREDATKESSMRVVSIGALIDIKEGNVYIAMDSSENEVNGVGVIPTRCIIDMKVMMLPEETVSFLSGLWGD